MSLLRVEKLIPMTKFVQNCTQHLDEFQGVYSTIKTETCYTFHKCERYAKFLTMKIEKWMFAPFHENGRSISEPEHIFSDHPDKDKSNLYKNSPQVRRYIEAQERCYFSGFRCEAVGIDDDADEYSYEIWFSKDNCLYFEFNKSQFVITYPDDYDVNYENIEDLTTCEFFEPYIDLLKITPATQDKIYSGEF